MGTPINIVGIGKDGGGTLREFLRSSAPVAAQGGDTEGQDAQRLGAEHEHPTPTGDAP